MIKALYLYTRRYLAALAMLAIALLSVQPANAQNLSLSGSVRDENNQPVPGVSVQVKGTQTGTTTNSNGQFKISAAPQTILEFRFVGYQAQDDTIKNDQPITIRLVPVTQSLQDVVVVGYGTQKKVNVTGSIASIKGSEVKTATTANVVNLLAGKLPGLRVAQRTSEPGDYATDFDIRGFGAPLVVIDGVQRTSADLSRMDPNEIDNVSVLKDASAAVYGVKSGNGVILVTTKRGKGATQFNYSSTFGLSQLANSPKTLDAYQYATLMDEAYINQGATPIYSAQQLEQYKSGALPTTNWIDLVSNKFSPMQQHSISANGASDKVQYYLSFGYYGETGMYKSGDLNADRYNFRSNITADLTKDLKVELLLSGFKDDKNSPGESTGSIFQVFWTTPPNITPYANNNPAYFNNVPDSANPLAMTNSKYSGYDDRVNKNFNGTVALNYKIPSVDGLKARLLYSYESNNTFEKVWRKQVDVYNYDAATQSYAVAGSRNAPTTLSQSYAESTSTTAQASLEYEKTIHSDHSIKALLLAEETKQSGLAFNGSRQFSLDAVDQLYAGNTLNQAINSGEVDPTVNQGLVGRINYAYKQKYLLEGSFRDDGSSKFADGHRWGFFPSVSGGWRISEEPFLKDKVSFLSDLKIRASYGVLGDDASSFYQYLSGYNYPGANYVFGNTLVNGLGFRGLTNEALSWYTSHLTNIGFDADMFAGKLQVSADVFRKKRSGLLATRVLSLPGSVGATLPQENLNSDQTQGLELAVSYRNHIGEFKYQVSGNVAFTRTKNLYVEQASPTNSLGNWGGNAAYRWNDIYRGYKVIGQFQNLAEIKSSPIEDNNGNRNVLPGDFKYEDVNHDGIIDGNDVTPIGRNSGTPEVSFGFTLGAQWKGFDINALFQGATNYTVSYLGSVSLDFPLDWGRGGLTQFMDRWHHQDLFDANSAWVPGKYPSSRVANGITRPDSWNYLPSDFWLADATYLRLKSLELGYTLPPGLIAKSGFIKSLRVYINGYDLVTWSGLNSLIDPEHQNTSYGLIYPITKSYNLGVNLTF